MKAMNRLTSREFGRKVAEGLEKMPFELELDGKVVAVIVSPEEYARLTSSCDAKVQIRKKGSQIGSQVDEKLARGGFGWQRDGELPFSKKAQASRHDV